MEVQARLTNGAAIYPSREDLADLPFWKCDTCGNHVGCHHKTKDRTKPLGCIPSQEMRAARKRIHQLIDPLWKSGKIHRRALYSELSAAIGREYHTAELRTMSEARMIYRTGKAIMERLATTAQL